MATLENRPKRRIPALRGKDEVVKAPRHSQMIGNRMNGIGYKAFRHSQLDWES